VDQRKTIDELRTQIAEGRYEVDPVMVADAIIRHRSSLAAAQRAGLRHADGSRRRRLSSVRRIAHRRSRGSAQALAA
jgi:Anti-sigma-28 factor, FlgM